MPGRPDGSARHRIVRENVSDYLDQSRGAYDAPLPRYVVDELEGYLACGRFERGFLRLRSGAASGAPACIRKPDRDGFCLNNPMPFFYDCPPGAKSMLPDGWYCIGAAMVPGSYCCGPGK